MKRWFETQGYMLVYRLAMRRGPVWGWLHDTWAEFWYRHYCPYPVKGNWRACECIAAGECGCQNGSPQGEREWKTSEKRAC